MLFASVQLKVGLMVGLLLFAMRVLSKCRINSLVLLLPLGGRCDVF